jgi:hypothetical protein
MHAELEKKKDGLTCHFPGKRIFFVAPSEYDSGPPSHPFYLYNSDPKPILHTKNRKEKQNRHFVKKAA